VALPTVTGVAGGPLAPLGGTAVVITGTNFNNGNVTAVNFGGVAASSFVITSGVRIDAVAPKKSGQTTVDVTVTNPSGTSVVSGSDQISYGTVYTPAVFERDEDPTAVAAGTFTTKVAALGLLAAAAPPLAADYPVLQFLGLGTPAQYAAGGGVSLI
jgi:hypothetical protein